MDARQPLLHTTTTVSMPRIPTPPVYNTSFSESASSIATDD